jgi:hypothetical protein
MNIDWGAIVTQILAYVLPVLTVAVLGWLAVNIKSKWAALKVLDTYNILGTLRNIVEVAVKAAEQTIQLGPDKKAYAIKIVEDFLDARGIKVDVSVIEAAIEKAVAEYFSKPPAEPAPTTTVITSGPVQVRPPAAQEVTQ